jgi:hypothetical protein
MKSCTGRTFSQLELPLLYAQLGKQKVLQSRLIISLWCRWYCNHPDDEFISDFTETPVISRRNGCGIIIFIIIVVVTICKLELNVLSFNSLDNDAHISPRTTLFDADAAI